MGLLSHVEPNFFVLNRLIGFLCMPLLFGSCLYQMSPVDFIRNPTLWLKCVSKYHCLATAAPNFAFEVLLKKTPKEVLDTIRLDHLLGILCGAEPIKPLVIESFLKVIHCCFYLTVHTFSCT
jgi:acyl-CoA synthetase (AMP-forming)/AMP-acid ligase II